MVLTILPPIRPPTCPHSREVIFPQPWLLIFWLKPNSSATSHLNCSNTAWGKMPLLLFLRLICYISSHFILLQFQDSCSIRKFSKVYSIQILDSLCFC